MDIPNPIQKDTYDKQDYLNYSEKLEIQRIKYGGKIRNLEYCN